MKRTFQTLCAAALAVAAMLTAGCSESGASESNSNMATGKTGSMARFAIAGDWLYTVNSYQLTVVSIADPAKPVEGEHFYIGGGNVETIFAMDTLLFIGSQSAMYIYDIREPEYPEPLSMSSHFRSCDPVVAADTLAFVTLNTSLGSWCGQTRDALLVYDISDVQNPLVIDEVALSSPRGLAVDADQKIVFVCDNGVKAYDITDPRNVESLYNSLSLPEVGRVDAHDCIVHEGRLIVIGGGGLYQLGYDREGFSFISKIDLR
jgi:hypothetical protein